MPRTKEITVYTLAELKEHSESDRTDEDTNFRRAYERALEKLAQWATMDSFWYECVIDDWQAKLAEKGFGYYSENVTSTRAEISFSGFWSQGDGASFTADVDLPEFIRAHYNGRRADRLLWIVEAADPTAKIVRTSRHYAHSLTVNIEFEPWWLTSHQDRDAPLRRTEQALMDLKEHIIEQARDYMHEIYRDLEKEYEYRTGEEALLEDAEANEYEFEADGTLA